VFAAEDGVFKMPSFLGLVPDSFTYFVTNFTNIRFWRLLLTEDLGEEDQEGKEAEVED
jgi:hypothetical protein